LHIPVLLSLRCIPTPVRPGLGDVNPNLNNVQSTSKPRHCSGGTCTKRVLRGPPSKLFIVFRRFPFWHVRLCTVLFNKSQLYIQSNLTFFCSSLVHVTCSSAPLEGPLVPLHPRIDSHRTNIFKVQQATASLRTHCAELDMAAMLLSHYPFIGAKEAWFGRTSLMPELWSHAGECGNSL